MPSQKLGIDWPATAAVLMAESTALSRHTAQTKPPRDTHHDRQPQPGPGELQRGAQSFRHGIQRGFVGLQGVAELPMQQAPQEDQELYRDRPVQVQAARQRRHLVRRAVDRRGRCRPGLPVSRSTTNVASATSSSESGRMASRRRA